MARYGNDSILLHQMDRDEYNRKVNLVGTSGVSSSVHILDTDYYGYDV